MAMHSPQRYGLATLAIALLLITAIAAFNAIVDPFNMYSWLRIEGFNANKPAVYTRMRLYKAYEVRRVKPQTIILGSSRTHVGLRCSHPALRKLEGPCYNLAFDGATTKEMYYYLRHAYAIQPLKHVIVGLDAYHPAPTPSSSRPDFDPLLLYADPLSRWYRFVTADLRLLLSIDTLRASIQTIRRQHQADPNWFAPDGQRLGEIFFRQVDETFANKGPRAYFDAIDQLEVHDQYPATIPKPPSAPSLNPEESSLSYIRRIIDFCHDKHIDLRLFLTPSHVHQFEINNMLWGKEAINNNKRALVNLLAAYAIRHPDQSPISLIDFSGYSSITTEALPPLRSRTEMRFYWDSSHFKEIVGDYVLDRMFNIHDPQMPMDFGVKLTSDNIETFLADQRKATAVFEQNHSEDIAALHALLPGLPILVYHEIKGIRQEPWNEAITVSLADFEHQMRYLHEQGYTTLSMPEVMDYLHGKPFPKKLVAIHFDDGWKSAQDAVPVLNHYGFKASFWIIAGAGHDTGSPHMDWDALLALAQNPNIDIYSHTMTHPWKEGQTLVDWVTGHTPGKGLKEAQWELVESKRLLEEKLHRPVPYLAWPSGFYNDSLIEMAKKAGYQGLLTIDQGFNHAADDPFRIRRIMIDGRCSFSVFKGVLDDGLYRDCANNEFGN